MSSTCVTCRFGCLVSHAGAAFRSDGKRPLGGFTWIIAWLWFGVDFAHLSAGFRWKLSPGGGTPFEEKVAPSATHQVAAHFAISSQIRCQPVSTRLNLFLKFFKSFKFSKIAVSWSMNFLVDLNIQNNLISRRKIENRSFNWPMRVVHPGRRPNGRKFEQFHLFNVSRCTSNEKIWISN